MNKSNPFNNKKSSTTKNDPTGSIGFTDPRRGSEQLAKDQVKRSQS